jgi:hypothetical protein
MEEKMRYIDAKYAPSFPLEQRDDVIQALHQLTDDGTAQIEDSEGNALGAIKVFERVLTDGSSYPVIQFYFEKE